MMIMRNRSRAGTVVAVKGQWHVPVGGHGISSLADSSSPCLRSADLPGLLVQGNHPASGGGLAEAEGGALGDDDVGVVQEPVDGRGGEGLGHDGVEAGGVNVALRS